MVIGEERSILSLAQKALKLFQGSGSMDQGSSAGTGIITSIQSLISSTLQG